MSLADKLAEAEQNLANWRAAEVAISTGQSYTIGTRQLTRPNLSDVLARIAYWSRAVEGLKAGRGTGIRVMRLMPRDF